MRPVRDRYADRTALASDAWERVIAPVWSSSMSAVIHSADSGDATGLAAALAPFTHPDTVHRAAGELLMVAAHDADLRGVLHEHALTPLAQVLSTRTPTEAQRAGIRGYVVICALGLLMESWRSTARDVDLTGPLESLARALRSPVSPTPLPDERAEHLDEGAVIDTGDALWDAVLRSTLRQVGTNGYEAATVEAIVAEAGCSQTVLFRHYPTKAEAFFDATRRMVGPATELNLAFQQRMAAEHSPGIAEALMLQEFMRPERSVERVIGIEQYRLAWHNPHLRAGLEAEQRVAQDRYLASLGDVPAQEAQARLHMEFALGMGPVLLGQLLPDSRSIPFDVVSVPFLEMDISG